MVNIRIVRRAIAQCCSTVRSRHEFTSDIANSTPSRRAAYQRPALPKLAQNLPMPHRPFSRAGSPRAPTASRRPPPTPKFCPAIQVLSNLHGQNQPPPAEGVNAKIPAVGAVLHRRQPRSEPCFVTPNALFNRDNSHQRRANRPPVAPSDQFAASRGLASRS